MLYNKLNLFLAAILVIVFILYIPVYNNWLNSKIINGADYNFQMSHLAPEERMINRFGTNYNVYHAIANSLKQQNAVDPVVLLPPKKYLKAMKLEGDFDVVEPEVFYYFTGYKSTSFNSPMSDRAGWALVVENHHPGLKKITDTAVLNAVRNLYKKYN